MSRRYVVQLLTASRLAFAATVAVLTIWSASSRAALWASFVLVLSIEVTDFLDGLLARRWAVVTDFGKMFDPYADAVSRLIVFWSLSRIGYCWSVVPLVLAVRDVTVAYIRVSLSRSGRDVSARWPGKIKAWIHGICAGFLFGSPLILGVEVAEAAVAPASILVILSTIVALIDHLVAARTALREQLTR